MFKFKGEERMFLKRSPPRCDLIVADSAITLTKDLTTPDGY